MVLDIETTGLDSEVDLIVQIALTPVTNRKAEPPIVSVLNWPEMGVGIDTLWLRRRMTETAAVLARNGRQYKFTYESLRAGDAPEDVFARTARILQAHIDKGGVIVGHNILFFDGAMLEANLARYGIAINWAMDRVIDTGLIEKALQLGCYPWPGDNLYEWFQRVSGIRAKVKWSLDGHCVPKYALNVKHGLPAVAKDAHSAEYDNLLVHYLLEEYRRLIQVANAEAQQHGLQGPSDLRTRDSDSAQSQ